MLRKILSVLAVATALALGAPAAANAVDDYPPPPPGSETLAGSFAISECVRDAPWIRYRVILSGADGQATGRNATLVLSRGDNAVEIPLGTLAGTELSGRVLWPGASVNAHGTPTGWPGWSFQNGQWVQTEGNFAWTRGPVSAVIRVGTDLSVPLAYPAATADCVAGPSVAGTTSSLAITGGTVSLAVAGVGVGLLALGGAAILVRRRRSAR